MLEIIGKTTVFKKGHAIKKDVDLTKHFNMAETKKILILRKGAYYFLVTENKQTDKIFQSKSVQKLLKQILGVENFPDLRDIYEQIESKVVLNTEGVFLDRNWQQGKQTNMFKLENKKDGIYRIQASEYDLEKFVELSEMNDILCDSVIDILKKNNYLKV